MKWPEEDSVQPSRYLELGWYEEALKAAERRLATLEAQGPSRRLQRASLMQTIITALVRLGRIEEAERHLKALENELDLPANVTGDDNTELILRSRLRNAKLEFVKVLLEKKRFEEAAGMLDEIERSRPDLATIDDRFVVKRYSTDRGDAFTGVSTWHAPSAIRSFWKPFDTLRWDLKEAKEAAAPDR